MKTVSGECFYFISFDGFSTLRYEIYFESVVGFSFLIQFQVTLSHTIYEGRAASLHSSTDPVVAVMGLDFTLRYFYKELQELFPTVCKRASTIRCFILDDSGYLIAHQGLIDPNGKGPVEQQHVTHKEPLVANDILNHRWFVRKRLCNSYNDRTIQRFYQFNTTMDGVLTNLVHGEHCAK